MFLKADYVDKAVSLKSLAKALSEKIENAVKIKTEAHYSFSSFIFTRPAASA